MFGWKGLLLYVVVLAGLAASMFYPIAAFTIIITPLCVAWCPELIFMNFMLMPACIWLDLPEFAAIFAVSCLGAFLDNCWDYLTLGVMYLVSLKLFTWVEPPIYWYCVGAVALCVQVSVARALMTDYKADTERLTELCALLWLAYTGCTIIDIVILK